MGLVSLVSDWDDINDAINASAFTTFGVAATYTAAATGSQPTTVDVVLYESVELINEDTGQHEARDQIHIHPSDVAQPKREDRVTVNGRGYRVDRYQRDYELWRVTLRRDGAA